MNWLTKFILSSGGQEGLDTDERDADPSEEYVGIHLFSGNGSGYEHIAEVPDEPIATQLINDLDWENGFFQVVVTLMPGVSMEVGGSMNGIDGLSAVYRNRVENQHLVTSVPPESKSEMVEILASFIRQDGKWQDKYQFD